MKEGVCTVSKETWYRHEKSISYNGPQILDTELRQTKTLKFVVKFGNTSRKNYTPEFKAQVAIVVMKEQSTLAELAKKCEVLPAMISHWKADLVKNAGAAFGRQVKSEEEFEKNN